ncbi:hypothetical protein EMIT0P176_390028 [Pseudomonas sp. IT-P176]
MGTGKINRPHFRSGFWLAIVAGAVVLGAAVQSYRRLPA